MITPKYQICSADITILCFFSSYYITDIREIFSHLQVSVDQQVIVGYSCALFVLKRSILHVFFADNLFREIYRLGNTLPIRVNYFQKGLLCILQVLGCNLSSK